MPERMKGLDELLRLFDTVPAAVNDELAGVLAAIGADVLSAQKAEVPVRTGDLWRGLGLQLLLDRLRVRVGLLGMQNKRTGRHSYGGLFYGRFVEFGRHAQTVIVHRLSAKARTIWLSRIRKGDARGTRKPADLAATYPMEIKAMPARPFVYSAPAEAAALDGAEHLANFWSNVLARAGS